MAGMFLIDFIVKRIESRKHAQYLESTRKWPSASAEIIDWKAVPCEADSEEPDKFQVQGTMGLTLGEDRFYGVLYSAPMIHGEARNFVASTTKPDHVTVRYDPSDPGEMIAAPVEGELPFAVRI